MLSEAAIGRKFAPTRPLAAVGADYFASGEVSPYVELGAYEWLWLHSAESYSEMAEVFRRAPGLLPSGIVNADDAARTAEQAVGRLTNAGLGPFAIRINETVDYPMRLRDIPTPPELLYLRGWADLLDVPKSVAVVGTREMTEKGARRTRKLVEMLVERNCTIVSGMERGIGMAAHSAAIGAGGATMAVLATPLSHHDPRTDHAVVRQLATEHLIVSAVPVLRFANADERLQRMFALERGRIMSALTDATIIVEAGAISSAVKQGETALKLGRKLFILNSCFDHANITWPARFEAAGAIRVRQFEQIVDALRR